MNSVFARLSGRFSRAFILKIQTLQYCQHCAPFQKIITASQTQTYFLFLNNKVRVSTGPPRQRNPTSDRDDRVVKNSRFTGESIDMSQASFVVGHDQCNNHFYIHLDDNKSSGEPTAKLEYTWIRPNLVDMYHTEVPPQFQGQGIAKVLAKAAFDYFSEKEVTMRPSCTYLQKYLKDNPIASYMDHVEKEFATKIRETS